MTKAERLVGTVIPVGALRGELVSGVGEFPDLVEFGHLCVDCELKVLQLLPVNDTGYASSPYDARSVFALHPLYLRLSDMPESKDFPQELAELNTQFADRQRFPYQEIMGAKFTLLRKMYDAHKEDIRASAEPDGHLAQWMNENPWIKDYVVYRRLKAFNGERSWKEWPEYCHVTQEEIDVLWNAPWLREEHLFWVWMQEALDTQFSQAADELKKMGIILEGDIPILINEDSADVWAHPELFHQELSAGAPPDMYSPTGQNWGFPAYNWAAHEAEGYAWWKARLKTAEKYYQAYRIDHVLGFFRLWVSDRTNTSSLLGRFLPYESINRKDLEKKLGFNAGRIRWMSQPHIPTAEVWDAVAGTKDQEHEANQTFEKALNRIGTEELWLFKDSIRGEKDIEALDIHPNAKRYLLSAWGNRLFVEYEPDAFFPTWYHQNSRAYQSLSGDEKAVLDDFLARLAEKSEKTWKKLGEQLLTMIAESSEMLPCAEDLGAVPECVPTVLKKLNILGLHVLRWTREWDQPGEPFIPVSQYRKLSVATSSVHDSSPLRGWWNKEADQQLLSTFVGAPSLPSIYNPGTAKLILHKLAGAASLFRVFPIQDLLHLSSKWYSEDLDSEQINVPGTVTDQNWTYRLPAPIAAIRKDAILIRAVQDVVKVKQSKK
ncbi:hypothetical protein FACS1894172_11550 [Spirochaetia bacterium]|nr:hypothetical protein FACS1894164_02900 [Spirochaetia bacterium]GHU33302.1 hypothetical protein FACS1894172_11550 [Spirochaetia bacterium]